MNKRFICEGIHTHKLFISTFIVSCCGATFAHYFFKSKLSKISSFIFMLKHTPIGWRVQIFATWLSLAGRAGHSRLGDFAKQNLQLWARF